MRAPIQRLWHHISHLPLLSIFRSHDPVPEPQRVPDKVELDKVAVTFQECEGDCGPSSADIQAKERGRAERFKGDQLLPIMGIGGGSPSPPS
ncbi:hypothetical protein [Microvirga aerophila]|uniref:Uncharacterized protein n=1 Tax=Microvirga aerophila TaxID=670291 RepID=A0A512BZ07_9HYPH|nr:hypothetical protein [Microvirga aerophila]GEO17067.1 hypothetical protein MAE02_47630 [Microvirga aerophila]